MITHPSVLSFSIPLFFLTFLGLLSINSTLSYYKKSKKDQNQISKHLFSKKICDLFWKKKTKFDFYSVMVLTQNYLRILMSGFLFISLAAFINMISWFGIALLFAISLLIYFSEFFPRFIVYRRPGFLIRYFGITTSLFIFLLLPFYFPLFRLFPSLGAFSHLESSNLSPDKEKFLELFEEQKIQQEGDTQEQKLYSSVITFENRIAREVMVPRVKMFSLPCTTSIKEAAQKLQSEGYSRTPIFKNTIDHIVGVLMWKDLLTKYMEFEKTDHDTLNNPIESILRPVHYTPETKKISDLLQEFQKKQVHFAIVVNEYGRTEGMITLEDILEEIVGEIEDEYDEEEPPYKTVPGGGWIIDAQMTIYDIEEQLKITLPQEGDYDTLGGYIFHSSGSIPKKGFTIQHDDFELKVLNSNERQIGKVFLKNLKNLKI